MTYIYKFLWGVLILGFAYTAFGIVQFKWMHHQINNPAEEFQVYGNPDADITFVEFLNYSCGYCKELHPTIQKLLEVRKDIKVVVRPIAFDAITEDGAPDPDMITRIAFAAGLQGKFKEFHAAFLEYPEPIIPDSFIEEIAMLYGINYDQLMSDSRSAPVEKITDQHWKLFGQFGLTSVPSFVMNGQPYIVTDESLPDLKQLLSMLENK